MKNIIINFLKGIIGGIGNIVPGLSGSALLVVLGVYDECIHAIGNIFKDFKKSVLYLLPIGIGIAIGTFIFSNIIELCLKNYETATSIVFLGFIIGTLPSLFGQAKKEKFNKSFLIPLIITFLIGISLLFFKGNSYLVITDYNWFTLILVGILIACSTIIPGISSTVLLTMIGMYDIYITAINTLNIKILFFVFIGLAIGAFLLSKIIDHLLTKYYGYTFYGIIGFVIATIPAIIRGPIIFNIEFVISVCLAIIACLITNFFTTKKK